MADEKLQIKLKISESSQTQSQSPAIGLTDVVHQEGSANPFDIGDALARPASYFLGRQESNKNKIDKTTHRESST